MEVGNREEVDFCFARESFRCASETSHF
jgi:hypothetical protein